MSFAKRQWFLILLAVALAIGFTVPDLVLALTGAEIIRYGVVAIVLLLMSLPLEASALRKSLSSPLAPALAILINAVLLPLAAIVPGRWLLDEYLGGGLLVAVAVPCTLASAAVWTRKAGGNYSIAILVTVFTNLFCFLIAPFWIWFSTGKDADIEVADMVSKLMLVVVLPMVIGQLIRLRGGIANWATRHKTEMSALAQCGILIMVCSGAAQAAQRFSNSDAQEFQVTGFLIMLLAINVLHIGALYFGVWIARVFGLPRGDQIAVGISGSQKTLMIGIVLSLELQVSILPILVYHICQLFVDTIIAQRFLKQSVRMEKETSNA